MKKTNWFGIISLMLGIAGLVIWCAYGIWGITFLFWGFMLGVFALFLEEREKASAIAGLFCVFLVSLICITMLGFDFEGAKSVLSETTSTRKYKETTTTQKTTTTKKTTTTAPTTTSKYLDVANYEYGFDYKNVSRYPDKYNGELYIIKGKVSQIQDLSTYGTTVMRMYVDGDYDQNLYVEFNKNILDANILVDDEVTLYAKYEGLYTYTTVLGSTLTVPKVKAYIIDINLKEDAPLPTIDDIEVMEEYYYSSYYYKYRILVVKNNSQATVKISTSSLAYDEDKNLLAAESAYVNAVGAGCTSVFYESYRTESEIDYFETDWTIKEDEYYESVVQDLSYKQNNIDGGAIFQVTNNGEEAAKGIVGYVLFFKKGAVISFDRAYFTDDDYEIKSGATIAKQVNCYEDYDEIRFYLQGRK